MSKRPEAAEDEQGAPWPPNGAAGAYIKDYGADPASPLNGILVEVGPYIPSSGLFETYTTVPVPWEKVDVGGMILCLPEELVPASDYAKAYIKATSEAAFPVYADEVYDVRDLLDKIGIAVTAESVALWSSHERLRVRKYAEAVLAGAPDLVPRPQELLP